MTRCIVIGGSAGSQAALTELLAGLPSDFPAAIFVATHLATDSVSHLPEILGRATALRVEDPRDGAPVEQGVVTVACRNHHLLIVDGHVRLGHGPRENLARPAIDPLFRSAAVAFGPATTGIVLTGMLNDGASGLQAIASMGGNTIVQDPDEAQARSMPDAALLAVPNALIAKVSEMPGLLARLVSATISGTLPASSDELRIEVDIALGKPCTTATIARIGKPSTLTCPGCAGVLSEIHVKRPLRYRCQVGHGYTADVVAKHTEGEIDEALRVALRIIEERVTLTGRMAADAGTNGHGAVAKLYNRRHAEYREYADVIRDAVMLRSRPTTADPGAT